MEVFINVTLCDLSHIANSNQNKKRKKITESAQYELEIIFNLVDEFKFHYLLTVIVCPMFVSNSFSLTFKITESIGVDAVVVSSCLSIFFYIEILKMAQFSPVQHCSGIM